MPAEGKRGVTVDSRRRHRRGVSERVGNYMDGRVWDPAARLGARIRVQEALGRAVAAQRPVGGWELEVD